MPRLLKRYGPVHTVFKIIQENQELKCLFLS